MVAKLAKIGIVPGQDFDASKLDSAVVNAIGGAPKSAQDTIQAWAKDGIAAGDNTFQNGWLFTTKTGEYGTNYLQRAYVTWIGLGANLPQDAVYPTSEGPDQDTKYSGAGKWVMHFDKGQLPPVRGFWSLTMYDAEYFFVDNPLNRYTLSQRDALRENADGSIDLYIQADSPGPDKESNWLPAPKDRFVLMLRMYWPTETPPSIIDGSWKVPAVRRFPDLLDTRAPTQKSGRHERRSACRASGSRDHRDHQPAGGAQRGQRPDGGAAGRRVRGIRRRRHRVGRGAVGRQRNILRRCRSQGLRHTGVQPTCTAPVPARWVRREWRCPSR